jgi:Zn-dependent protease with chaperone function
LQADKNAALYLVEPKKLADALTKIHSLKTSTKTLGLMTMVGSFVGIITHPSFKERINHLNSLTPIYEA